MVVQCGWVVRVSIYGGILTTTDSLWEKKLINPKLVHVFFFVHEIIWKEKQIHFRFLVWVWVKSNIV
jgi:hypothetical protein